MLDYAANAQKYWPVDRMREAFSLTCVARGTDPADEVMSLLGADADPEAFWEAAKRNLRDGRVRLLFVADVIPPPLKAVIEFLNRQMTPAEVLGIEIRQFVGGPAAAPLRTLVPRVFGQTEEVKLRKDSGRAARAPIDEEEFYALLPDGVLDTIRALSTRLKQSGYKAVPRRTPSGNAVLGYVVPELEGVEPINVEAIFGMWISLGGEIPALRIPSVNAELRRRLLDILPGRRKQISNSTKGPIGARFDLFADPSLGNGVADVMSWVRSKLLDTAETDGAPSQNTGQTARHPEDSPSTIRSE